MTLRLGRVTVLVGANGAGKSNVLRALRMVALMRARSLQRFAGESGGASSLLHYGPKKSRSMEISLVWSMDNQALEARGFGSGHSESRLSHYDIPPDVLSRDRLLSEINDFVSKMSFFHFHDTSLAAALRTHARAEDDQALRSDGGNLAACLPVPPSTVEREGGCSVLRRLDPAALQVWLEEYTLSEIFNKGVIGGCGPR